jgi:hypothetical protein
MYTENIRIGNKSDALTLLEEMIEKCNLNPSFEYDDFQKKVWEAVKIVNLYYLPRLEALREAVHRDII